MAMDVVFTNFVGMTMADQLWLYAIGPLQASRLTLSDILFLALLPAREAGTNRFLTLDLAPNAIMNA